MGKQTGFTLIELVLVIVIIGILAAFALPRFSDLSTEAREAALDGVAGGIRSAAALAHAQQLAQGLGSSTGITMEGTAVAMVNGYPAATAGGIEAALVDTTGFTTTISGTVISFEKDGAGTPATCDVEYTEVGGGGGFPTINVVTGGCP